MSNGADVNDGPGETTRPLHVLVAGSTGHLGREVVAHLLTEPGSYRVTRLVRPRGASDTPVASDVRTGDVTRPATLRGVCDGIDVVVSCVGASVSLSPTPGQGSYDDVDAAGNLNLLSEAERAGVSKVVYVSAALAPGILDTAYVKAHERVVAALRQRPAARRGEAHRPLLRPPPVPGHGALGLRPDRRRGRRTHEPGPRGGRGTGRRGGCTRRPRGVRGRRPRGDDAERHRVGRLRQRRQTAQGRGRATRRDALRVQARAAVRPAAARLPGVRAGGELLRRDRPTGGYQAAGRLLRGARGAHSTRSGCGTTTTSTASSSSDGATLTNPGIGPRPR